MHHPTANLICKILEADETPGLTILAFAWVSGNEA
jgi:hypothetical protein